MIEKDADRQGRQAQAGRVCGGGGDSLGRRQRLPRLIGAHLYLFWMGSGSNAFISTGTSDRLSHPGHARLSALGDGSPDEMSFDAIYTFPDTFTSAPSG